jgi:16S rRNA pseudouridine516 synthase
MDYLTDTIRKDLFPVGRLDIDTEGLLLITNDGALAHELLSPAHHVPKTYYAKVAGKVTEEDVNLFKCGVDIGEDKPTKPAELVIRSSGAISEITLTITEGKFHQVKRMFQAVGKEVVYLKRLSMGGLTLPKELAPGEYRALTQEELERIRRF